MDYDCSAVNLIVFKSLISPEIAFSCVTISGLVRRELSLLLLELLFIIYLVRRWQESLEQFIILVFACFGTF